MAFIFWFCLICFIRLIYLHGYIHSILRCEVIEREAFAPLRSLCIIAEVLGRQLVLFIRVFHATLNRTKKEQLDFSKSKH